MKKTKRFLSAILAVVMLLSTSAFAADAGSSSTDDAIPTVDAILLGDTGFTFSTDDFALARSGGQATIEKYITMGETLEDGTVVLNMSSVTPRFNRYLPVCFTLTQVSASGGNYRYRVLLEIGLVGSGTAVKSFSASLDYGDGSYATNRVSYNNFETVLVELAFPDKYYKAGSYTVKITNYNLLISSDSNMWNPSTEQAGLSTTMFNVTVPQ